MTRELLDLPSDREPAVMPEEIENMSEAEMAALIEEEFALALAQEGRR